MSTEAKRVPSAPPGAAALLSRARLEERLDGAFGKRLTTVVAGPGYGKTTLLAQWSRDLECAWHTVAPGDAQLDVFVEGLRGALAPWTRAPGTERGAEATAPGEPLRANALAATLASELQESLEHDLIIVVDDVHELGSSSSLDALEAFVRHAPALAHVVLASRTESGFRIDRLRAEGHVLELDASELAFTYDEIGDLLELTLGTDARALAGQLSELTQGWPAAARLAIEALARTDEAERCDALERLRSPTGPLLSYLAGEVLGAQPPEVRALLRTLAPFERFTPELCETLGVEGARGTIESLRRQGLFLTRHGTGLLSLHALVRELAAEELAPSDGELAERHRQAAVWFEEHGFLDDAIRSVIDSGDRDELARFVVRNGEALVASGAIELVLLAGRSLPPSTRDARVEQVVGEAHALKGDWEEALACYERAAAGTDGPSPALAWRIGRVHFDRGEPEQALEAYRRATLDGGDPGAEALLHAAAASAHLTRGELDDARDSAREALTRAERAGDSRALALAHNVSMVLALRIEPDRADEHYRRGLEAAESAGEVLQIVRIRSNYVAHLIQRGSYADALTELEPAIALAESAGAPLALAFSLLKRGEARLYLGALDLAIADFGEAKALYERLGSNRAFGALLELGEVYRERGDPALARAALEEAMQGAVRTGDAQVLAYAQANLARVLAGDDSERSRLLATDAVDAALASGHGVVFALLSAGWVALAEGDQERAATWANEAARAARKRSDLPGSAEAHELAALAAPDPRLETGRLEEALRLWQEVASPLAETRVELALAQLQRDRERETVARTRLRELGVRPEGASAGLLGSLVHHRAEALRIRALGMFTILRAGDQVAPSEWRSRKARDLLKILVTRRGRPAPRGLLMELLWPEEEPGELGNRLSVALSNLRAVLDPDRRFDPERFVSSGDTGIVLHLENVSVDVEEFLADAEAGLALVRAGRADDAHARLRDAESAYAGDFLEADAYEDWAVDVREEARAAYVATAKALAGLAATESPEEACRFLLRALEREPYDEQAHLELVTRLAEAGHHGEARRAYSTYAARMAEIGLEATPYPAVQRHRAA